MNGEFGLQTLTTYSRTKELALWAEAAGLYSFAAADHYLPDRLGGPVVDQLTLLAAVGALTSKLRLYSLMSPVSFRHPAVVAKVSAALNDISTGRFTLGIGTGWMRREHELFGFEFLDLADRYAQLSEAITYIRLVLSGTGGGMDGDRYRLQPGVRTEPVQSDLRVAVGGAGRIRTPRLAALVADELNLTPSSLSWRTRVATAREACEMRGRDPNSLVISAMFPLVVSDNPDELDRIARVVAMRRGLTVAGLKQWLTSHEVPHGDVESTRAGIEGMQSDGISRFHLQVKGLSFDQARRSVESILSRDRI